MPRGRPKSKINQPDADLSEHQHQVRVVAYLKRKGYLVASFPNAGKRTQIQGHWMREEGMASGMPDLIVPMPRNGQHGLFIEMKTHTGQLTDNQKFWMEQLAMQGYAVHCCKGYLAAIKVIDQYFGEQQP